MLSEGFSESGSFSIFYSKGDRIFVVLWFLEKQAVSWLFFGGMLDISLVTLRLTNINARNSSLTHIICLSIINQNTITFWSKIPDKCFGFTLELIDEFAKIALSAFGTFIGHHQGLFACCVKSVFLKIDFRFFYNITKLSKRKFG